MADKIDKLAQVIANSAALQEKRINKLISIVEKQLNPKISVQAPQIPEVKVPSNLKIPPVKVDVSGIERAISKIKLEKPKDVDLSSVEELLQDFLAKDFSTKVDVDRLVRSIESIRMPEAPDFSELLDAIKNIKVSGGGAIGPSKIFLRNEQGAVVDPSTVKASDSPSIDAFGRWRVSNPVTLFDSKQLWDNQPLFWDDSEESGSGTSSTFSADNARTRIGVGATTAGKRTRQTFQRFNYQPGKSQLIFMTTVMSSASNTGIKASVGMFDDDNGIFFTNDEGTLKIVRRTNVTGSAVDNEVSQSSFNLDKMDGTGPSRVSIDPTKTQIMVIDFEWLGVGRVRCGFVVDGKIYYAHQFLNTNSLTEVYMSTPNLPLRYQIENDGTGAATTMDHICSTVISEGGQEDTGILRYSSTNNTQVDCAVVGTVYAVKGIRLKSTHLDAAVKMVSAAMQMQSASDDVEWRLYFDPTIAGSPTWNNVTNSAVQEMTGATANTITGGTQITGGYLATGAGQSSNEQLSVQLENALRLGAAIDGTVQSIVLAAVPLTNVNTLVEGALTWRELS